MCAVTTGTADGQPLLGYEQAGVDGKKWATACGMKNFFNLCAVQHTNTPTTMNTKHIPIPGYDGYAVSRDGSVWSTASNWRGYGIRELAQHPDKDGYMRVRMIKNGKRIRVAVHRIMVLAFYGPMPAPNMEVRHLNGKRSENNISNLAWGSKSQNALDRNAHGTAYRPNWSDPKNREKWTEAMRKAKVRAAIAKATGNIL